MRIWLALFTFILAVPSHQLARAQSHGRPLNALRGMIEIEGLVTAETGDTIKVAGVRIKLFATRAPALDEECFYLDGRRADSSKCGPRARAMMRVLLVISRGLRCRVRGRDGVEGWLAICSRPSHSKTLGGWMISHGLARPAGKYESMYAGEVINAASSRFGFWNCASPSPKDYLEPKRKICRGAKAR